MFILTYIIIYESRCGTSITEKIYSKLTLKSYTNRIKVKEKPAIDYLSDEFELQRNNVLYDEEKRLVELLFSKSERFFNPFFPNTPFLYPPYGFLMF